MQVEVSDSFPYPNMFLITGRAAGAMAPPVQPVGVLIVKQTVLLDGTIPPSDQQEAILLTDEEYDPPSTNDDDLVTYLEADLAAYKPKLDIVAARDNFNRGSFGSIRIDRNDGNGFQPEPPDPPLNLDWGWQSRVDNPRKAQAGIDPKEFTPDVNDPFKLPDGFENLFFNGSRIRTEAHLEAGNRVEFGTAALPVTIPAGPALLITFDGAPISPTVSIELNCDTVVFDQTAGHYLVTWRAVFPWEDRLTEATLEVR